MSRALPSKRFGIPYSPLLEGSTRVLQDPTPPSPPGSILHISGFVALCEMFLGCEAHFELWKKYFCLVLRTHKGSTF